MAASCKGNITTAFFLRLIKTLNRRERKNILKFQTPTAIANWIDIILHWTDPFPTVVVNKKLPQLSIL